MVGRGVLVGLLLLLPLGLDNGAQSQAASRRAGDEGAGKEVRPQKFTMPTQGLALDDILRLLHKQTGNQVSDRRPVKNGAKLKLDLQQVSFWQALEAIAQAANCGISLYQPDGQIALVEGPYRAVPLCYSGVFRVALKRIELTRETDSGVHACIQHLEVAWEPRLQPFFLGIGPAKAVFAPDSQGRELAVEVPSRGQVHVAGRNAIEIQVRTPGPHRSSPQLASLKGDLRLIVPGKMLTFTFGPLKALEKNGPWKQEQEGIKVSLTGLTMASKHWALDLLIENPPGGPQFESYQSWLDNNLAVLENQLASKGRLPSSGEEQLEDLTARRAALRYYFKAKDGQALGQPGNWALHYRTPGRIVEVPLSFSFQAIPLP